VKAALEKQRQFVGDASHELRTPLARIRITTSSALEQESSPEEMKEALEIADRETVHMSNLVDQLLMLARLDSGLSPSLSKVNLADIVREAFDKFPAEKSDQVRLELETPAFIVGDPEGLVRAVINLLENAKRYSEGKEIVVRTQVVHGQGVLSVRDHGVGIEPQHLSRLTERFYRVDDARNRKMGGTGLGLAIVKSIVESSHGLMQIHSKPNEGTIVELSFPAI
jgi:two-component system phosphate regulon sensor histidine kinase PhoR